MTPAIIVTGASGLTLVLSMLAAYTLGCFNAGYYLVRWKTGRDVRQLGSGNAGATNVGRVLGRWGFAIAMLGDMLKGAVAVHMGRLAGLSETGLVVVMLAVVAGHNWPAQLGFRGGKGVATTFGALLIFNPIIIGELLGLCVVLLAITRRPTISGLAAYAMAPVAAAPFGYDGLVISLLVVLPAVVTFPHWERLRQELSRRSQSIKSNRDSPAADISRPLQFKIATEEWEFEAIHRLNYRTFVEEIPQHAPNSERRLVDRFHSENQYLIILQSGRLVGMMVLRGQRPFSLDGKVTGLDRYLPAGCRPVEARLLAVEPDFRRTAVFVSLFGHAVRHCLDAGFDVAVISATTRQLKLYRHLGFTPFGSLVGTAEAPYQPMFLTLENFGRTSGKSPALRPMIGDRTSPGPTLNLLPGPVLTTAAVDSAFAVPPVSHRSPAFLAQIEDVRHRLCQLTGARNVQVLPGSGSLANTVVAAQLSLRDSTGLVISNGEFGERLASEARRAQLRFQSLRLPWGTVFDLAEVDECAARIPAGGWIWAVHHETSTGMLNPLEGFKSLAARHGLRLCLDCISSIGAEPVDLRGVHLATSTSGKGLGAYPGLALVFHDYEPRAEPERLPGYLDLGHWAGHASVPHTHSSNLVAALAAALQATTPARMSRIRDNSVWLRTRLREQGWMPLVPDSAASPGIVTIALNGNLKAPQVGNELERQGFSLSFRSSHLIAHNWIQIALLGDPPRSGLESLLNALHRLRGSRAPAATPVLPVHLPSQETVELSRV